MINKDQAHGYFYKLAKGVDLSNMHKFKEVFMEYMKYLAENYINLDDEMKEVYDKSTSAMLEAVKVELDKSPESIEKRESIRLYKRAKREHYDINELIKILEKPRNDPDGILNAVREIFIKRMQNILDFLSDAQDHSHKYTTSNYAIFQLYYITIDELLAAFHLSQHSFVNQADTHIRTILENLDKIELFYKQPEWADLWISQDPKDKKEKWKQLRPRAIRRKLGKDEHSDLYSMLSELGTHSEFRSVQTRSNINKELDEKGNISLQLWIGGCPYEHNIVFTNSFLLYAVSLTMFSIVNVLMDFLLDSEVDNILKGVAEDIKSFNICYFIPWAAEEDFDITPFLDLLLKPLWNEE